MNALSLWFNGLKKTFILCFITDNRWEWIAEGFINSVIITIFALLLGLVVGIILAAIRSSYDKNEESLRIRGGIGYYVLKILNVIAKTYITVMRGVPVVVQLMIWYFVILVSAEDVPIAIVAFGLNSGAYVAEIFRGGIMSIDNGQFEAGRSLGFSYFQTMRHIVIPQTIKSTLPTLLNELIALFKETSIAGYVGILDLTKAGERIRGITFEAFMPLIAVAIVYLLTVILLTKMVAIIERRLRRNER
ncbi:MAG: amino acid ABC transporter permease [Clostridia bacterium]|nr:amino acid ABC transporter permease [Clostridia bacterium]